MVDNPSSLSFKPKLFLDDADKKLAPTQGLFKDLKQMSKELSLIDQEYVNTRSLQKVAGQLVSPLLVTHKNNTIQAYTACCLVDTLRLFAPDAPYNSRQLKDIFYLLIRQLKALESAENPLYSLATYILDSLCTVKSTALSAEADDSEEIMILFFETLFDIINNETPRRIQIQMAEVLQQLIEENSNTPQKVLDTLLLQFLKKRQTENPSAHQLSIIICNNTTPILQKYVCQYFNDIIIASSKNTPSSTETLNNLKTAHYLILELNKTAPGVLQNVVPQLEEELNLDEISIRTMATQVLGEMFLEKGYTLAARYAGTWNSWMTRRSDKSNAVRIMWVEYAVLMLQNQPQLAKKLEGPIVEKLEDIDEKVRKAACSAFTKLEITAIVQNGISERMIEVLGERCKDRKQGPRIEATQALSHIYDQVYDNIAAGNKVTTQKFGRIPSMIMNLIYVGINDVICNAEAALFGGIFGSSATKDDSARCVRLVSIYTMAQQKSKTAFIGFLKRQSDVIIELELLLKYASETIVEEGNDELRTRKIGEMAKRVSEHFPDSEKVGSSLLQLVKLDNSSIFDSITKVMDPYSDFKAIRKEQKSVMKKVRDLAPNLLEHIAMLLRTVSLTTINKNIVSPLLEMAQKQNTKKKSGKAKGMSSSFNGNSGSGREHFAGDSDSDNNNKDHGMDEDEDEDDEDGEDEDDEDEPVFTGPGSGNSTNSAESSNQDAFAMYNNVFAGTSEFRQSCLEILKIIVKTQPTIFANHVDDLFSMKKFRGLATSKKSSKAYEEQLYTMALFARQYPSQVPTVNIRSGGGDLKPFLEKFVVEGNESVSKYAATILAKTEAFAETSAVLVNTLAEDLLLCDDESQGYVWLAALSRFALLNHKLLDNDVSEQLAFALQSYLKGEANLFNSAYYKMNTISTPVKAGDKDKEKENERMAVVDLEEKNQALEQGVNRMNLDENGNAETSKNTETKLDTQEEATEDVYGGDRNEFVARRRVGNHVKCKVYSLKFLINRVSGYGVDQVGGIGGGAEKSMLAEKVLDLLRDIISGKIAFVDESEKMHLQLVAGSGIMKMARQQRYDRMITQGDIESLVLLVRNRDAGVRSQFIFNKLIKPIAAKRVKTRFIPLLFFVAEDAAMTRQSVKRFVQSYERGYIEQVAILFLLMVSRLRDFSGGFKLKEACTKYSVYIDYYISLVATSDNVAWLYSYATQLKTVRDSNVDFVLQHHAGIFRPSVDQLARATKANNNLWVATDLFLFLLQQKCSSSNWTLTAAANVAYPEILKATNLFSRLTSDQQFVVMSTNFLPSEFSTNPGENLPQALQSPAKRRKAATSKISTPGAGASVAGTPVSAKRAKKSYSSSSVGKAASAKKPKSAAKPPKKKLSADNALSKKDKKEPTRRLISRRAKSNVTYNSHESGALNLDSKDKDEDDEDQDDVASTSDEDEDEDAENDYDSENDE